MFDIGNVATINPISKCTDCNATRSAQSINRTDRHQPHRRSVFCECVDMFCTISNSWLCVCGGGEDKKYRYANSTTERFIGPKMPMSRSTRRVTFVQIVADSRVSSRGGQTCTHIHTNQHSCAYARRIRAQQTQHSCRHRRRRRLRCASGMSHSSAPRPPDARQTLRYGISRCEVIIAAVPLLACGRLYVLGHTFG